MDGRLPTACNRSAGPGLSGLLLPGGGLPRLAGRGAGGFAGALVCSNLSWLIFGKLCEARSRLYRRRFLQVSTRVKALDAIYKITHFCTAPNAKNQLNFVKHVRILAVLCSN